MKYSVELVWNKEFHWVEYGGPLDSIDAAIAAARAMENSGDGARVKKTRVVREDGHVVWAYGKLTGSAS